MARLSLFALVSMLVLLVAAAGAGAQAVKRLRGQGVWSTLF